MTLFERVHLPSFAGATEWLNSEPLGPAELEGHVVLGRRTDSIPVVHAPAPGGMDADW